MFEDSLVESKGRIRTQSRWFAIGSFLTQGALLLSLIIFPLLNPLALPKQSIERLLIAPPPPRAPAPVNIQHASAPASSHPLPSLQDQLRAPRSIPTEIATVNDPGPQAPAGVPDVGSANGSGLPGGILLGGPAPTVTVAKPPTPQGPVRVSTGVATGQLLSPIRPIYPAIAKQARIQGKVVMDATISREGTIAKLRVIDGPATMRQAAVDAVAEARNRPFLLNGEPVEVQTSIRVIFSLGE
jgi:protein TonB